MRFSLIDRIERLEPGQSISAIKSLSLAEEYLADHFPGFPVMPGVLMLESLVQAGAWLLRFSDDFAYSTILLKQAKAVKFSSFVEPGDVLTLDVRVHKQDGRECTLKGTGTVDGRTTVSARFTLESFNLAERDSELARSDKHLIEKLRELSTEIWPVTKRSLF